MKVRIKKLPSFLNLSNYNTNKTITFADGGSLGGYHTNGADWEAPGNLRTINTGGTHEENMNEGVQLGVDPLGTPNLVELGEVVYNDYVFSNRLKVPQRRKGKETEKSDLSWEEKMLKRFEGKTYADAAKKVYKEFLERPNDTTEKRGLEVILGILAGSQEKERAKQLYIEAANEIDSMSGAEFMQMLEMERLAMQLALAALQQLIQEQLIALLDLTQLDPYALDYELQQMSPEQLMMELQAMEQQAMQQLPMAAYGGKFKYALGGQMNMQQILQMFALIALYALLNAQQEPELFQAVLLVRDINGMLLVILYYLQTHQLQLLQQYSPRLFLGYAYGGKVNKFSDGGLSSIFYKDFDDFLAHYLGTKWAPFKHKEFTEENLLDEEKQKLENEQFNKYLRLYQAIYKNEKIDPSIYNNSLALYNTLLDWYNDVVKNKRLEAFYTLGKNISELPYDIATGLYHRKKSKEEDKELNPLNIAKDPKDLTLDELELANEDNTLTERQRKKIKHNLDAHYRSRGINPKKLTGYAKKRYERDLQMAYRNAGENTNYDITEDLYLDINDESIRTRSKSNNLATYQNNSLYNTLLSNGAIDNVKLKDNKVLWDPITGLTKLDIDDDFWKDISNFTEDNGIYNYKTGTEQEGIFDDQDDFLEYYRELITNKFKALKGDSYSDDKLKNYYLNGAEARAWVKELEEKAKNGDAKAGELAAAIKANWGNEDTNWGDDATWEFKNKYNKKGTIGESDSYGAVRDPNNELQSDGLFGIEHIPYLEAINRPGTADRYYYTIKGPDGSDTPVWIYRPSDELLNQGFKIGSPKVTNINGVNFNDYLVTGYNKNRRLYRTPDGRIIDVTNVNDPRLKWKTLKKGPYEDDLTGIGEGITPTTTWVDLDLSDLENNDLDPFPKARDYPYWAVMGLQGAGLLYNTLTPIDYSNADSVINAAKNAADYERVGFEPIPDFMVYNPFDRNFEGAKIRAMALALNEYLNNLSGGNRGQVAANMLANNLSYMDALGDIDRKAAEANRAHLAAVKEFNKSVNQYNSEGRLKADIANQNASVEALKKSLELLAKGYDMRLTLQDNKAKAISNSLSGLADSIYNYETNRHNQDMLGWGIRHKAYGQQDINTTADGGTLKVRKYKRFI